ncbi:putative aspartic-type endopeptidase [Venturia nashicola]|nr:putative aspartic-type endopeptidase [Venturia nashicola]
MRLSLLGLALFGSGAFSLALQKRFPASTYAVKESHSVPKSWTRVASAPADHTINLRIGLTQGRFDELEKILYEISDPDHHQYGQHLSTDEVNALVKPTEETSRLVHAWLADNGISSDRLSYSPSGDWITCHMTIGDANKLLSTSYSTYQHETDGTVLVRTPEFSVPRELHQHIATIQPTNSFMRTNPKRSTLKPSTVDLSQAEVLKQSLQVEPAPPGKNPSIAAACVGRLMTAPCLRTLYGTINYVPKATAKASIGVANYLGELTIRADAKIYLQQYRPEAVAGAADFKQFSIDGGTLDQNLNNSQREAEIGVEGALDIQTILGIAWPVPLVSYSTGGLQPGFKPDQSTPTNSNEPYLAWVQYMLGQKSLPNVVSTSYGDDEQTMSPEYAKSVCDAFAQLGAKGVSLLFSSGDNGVGNNGACVSNNGTNAKTFLPSFPASCPYVTSVGGTYKTEPEVAALDGTFTSGGGFSDYFARPAYQEAAVAEYLKTNQNFPKFAGMFKPSGRAYPDIAAQSVAFATVYDGRLHAVDGTSAASPAAAAIVALVNDALLAAGKPVLGFMNPWLYKGGSAAFTDILSGSAAGCDGNGFPAGKGWDAVTGFGTPYFPKILSQLGLKA